MHDGFLMHSSKLTTTNFSTNVMKSEGGGKGGGVLTLVLGRDVPVDKRDP